MILQYKCCSSYAHNSRWFRFRSPYMLHTSICASNLQTSRPHSRRLALSHSWLGLVVVIWSYFWDLHIRPWYQIPQSGTYWMQQPPFHFWTSIPHSLSLTQWRQKCFLQHSWSFCRPILSGYSQVSPWPQQLALIIHSIPWKLRARQLTTASASPLQSYPCGIAAI